MTEGDNDSDRTRRNRVKTELKILNALEKFVTEKGFESLGINAIAQSSGVSKELIYRYFGGLEGLLLAWVEERDYWSLKSTDRTYDKLLAAGADARLMVREIVLNFADELRANPQVQEIRRLEVASRSPLAARIAARREEGGSKLVSRIPDTGEDPAAIVALLQAGLCYLVLRSTTLDTYCGVSLTTEEGWKRLAGAVDTLLNATFQNTPAESSKEKTDKKRRVPKPKTR